METSQLIEYDRMGREHWWLTSKYIVLRDILKRKAKVASALMPMLDVGCAGGVFMERVHDLVPEQYGLDRNFEILSYCKPNGAALISADAAHPPFKRNSFGLITAIDILEHLEDDSGAMKEFHGLLRDGGYLLISVPAYMFLYGKHDELFGHRRRYTRKQILKMLRASGFQIEKATYVQPLFLFPLWIKRRLMRSGDDIWGDFTTPHPIVNMILKIVLVTEKFLLHFIDFPFGATLFILVRKKT